ncbi:MAG: hypothetical protein JXR03_15650 [Cyclobacteriaceae bacterium]
MAPLILLAIIQAIIISFMSYVWKATHPIMGFIVGFIGFFITFVIFGMLSFLFFEMGVNLDGIVFYLIILLLSTAFWLGFLRLLKRIKEDK